jgi:hypothetical protein
MKHGLPHQDRVEADLRCLMCSRLIGQLCGLVWRDFDGQRTTPSMLRLTEFRPSIPGAPSVPVTGRNQLRCGDCGGVGVVEEILVSPAGESLKVEEGCPIHHQRLRGPGRPPRGCQCGDLRVAA